MARLVLAGESYELDMLSKWAPITCAALVKQREVNVELQQSTWCGPTLTGALDHGPLLDIDTLEQPVISIYPGTICLRPREGKNASYDSMIWAKSPPEQYSSVEFAIAYGYGEYRTANGPLYITPIAMIRNFDATVAAKIQIAGAKGSTASFTFEELDHEPQNLL